MAALLTAAEWRLALGSMLLDGYNVRGAARAAGEVVRARIGYGRQVPGTLAADRQAIATALATAYAGSGVLAAVPGVRS